MSDNLNAFLKAVTGDHAHAHEIQENKIIMGLVSGAIGAGALPRYVNALSYKEVVESEKKRQRDEARIEYFLNLLDQLDQLERDLTDSINDRLEGLKEKYGEDPISGIAETHLSPEELEGAETPEEKMNRLVNKYLDKDGKPKPGAEHLDPEILALLQEWRQRDILRSELPALRDKIREEGMTPENQKSVDSLAERASDDQTYALMKADAATPEIVEALKEADMAEADEVKTVVNSLDNLLD